MAIKVDKNDLMQAIKQAKPIMVKYSGNELDRALLFDLGSDGFHVVAANAHVLGVWRLWYEGDIPNFIIEYPKFDFGDLVDEMITIDLVDDGKFVQFSGASVSYRVPTIEGSFFDWRKVCMRTEANKVRIAFQIGELVDVLKSIDSDTVVFNIGAAGDPVLIEGTSLHERRIIAPLQPSDIDD